MRLLFLAQILLVGCQRPPVPAPGNAPMLAFTAPADGDSVVSDTQVQVEVRVADADEEDLAALTLSWSGSVVGAADGPAHPDSSGYATFTLPGQPSGEWTLEAEVTDAGGLFGKGSVAIEVIEGDGDGDGHVAVALGGDDCDDGDAAVYPGADEACGGGDEDCDGLVDEAGATGESAWYADKDGDGYGDSATGAPACARPDGAVDNGLDCADGDPTVSPDAAEVCDGLDNDCDGLTDDADPDVIGQSETYGDADGDGYGAGRAVLACEAPPGNVGNGADCQDDAPDVHPEADETCDDVDNDCDGLVDDADPDAIGRDAWYIDIDGDGYGAEPATPGCVAPVGYVADGTDCNDATDVVHPGADEVCDDLDDDCDGRVDDADPSVSGRSDWYPDADGDGSGAGAAIPACRQPDGYVANADDCDDTDPTRDLVCGPVSLADADAKLEGIGSGEYAGGGLAAAGDVNGDGLGDVLVTARGNDAGGENAGAAYVMLGPIIGEHLLSDAAWILNGAAAGDLVDVAAGFGDGDGDGLDDVAVGAPSAGSGAVYVARGGGSGTLGLESADLVVTGAHSADYLGYALASAGDQDRDRHPDLLVGAFGSDATGTGSGAAYVISGSSTGTVSIGDAAVATILGPRGGVNAGVSVAGGSDTDGDGVSDLLIGTSSGTSTSDGGQAYLVVGPVAGTVNLSDAASTLTGEVYLDRAGREVALPGDTDGDGYGDVLIGAVGSDALAADGGAAYLFQGPLARSERMSGADGSLAGATAGDSVGGAVAAVGDVNGDGRADLLVGGYGDDAGGLDAGAAWVMYGPLTGAHATTDADQTFWGEHPGDAAAAQVAGAGDVDGDGRPDLLVAAENESANGPQSGAAYLLLSP